MVKIRYKMIVSYDGTNYYGYAKQEKEVTIQGEIESVLSKILDEPITIYASGRTDKGVHALGQVIDFVTEKHIEVKRLLNSINKLLPKDIFIKKLNKVNIDFSSRFNAKNKKYMYILNNKTYDPLKMNYEYYDGRITNIEAMKEASKLFIGEHNFQNFTSKEEDKDNFVRTINNITFKRKNGRITIEFEGNGFMRYEVRKLVGVLFEIGKGKLNSSYIKDLLAKKERDITCYTAEPQGLYLVAVKY